MFAKYDIKVVQGDDEVLTIRVLGNQSTYSWTFVLADVSKSVAASYDSASNKTSLTIRFTRVETTPTPRTRVYGLKREIAGVLKTLMAGRFLPRTIL